MCLAFGLISVLLDQTSCVLFPFLVMYMVSMYTVQWHLSVKIARNGSPSSWTGQIDSFIQTLQVDLVLERTRCKCFCSASTVVPSTMRRTITEYGKKLTATGEGLIGPRGTISIPTPVFFVSLFLFLSVHRLFLFSIHFSSLLPVLFGYVWFIGSG